MSNWVRIKDFNRISFSGKALRSCYLGKVFRVTRSRSSYNWSWSYNFIEPGIFHPNIECAIRFIEKNRSRGSKWIIDESPALCLCFDSNAIIICSSQWDSHHFHLFWNFEEQSKKGFQNLVQLKNDLKNRYGIHFYKQKSNFIEPITKRLKTHNSVSMFGFMSWTEWDSSYCIPRAFFDLLSILWLLTKPGNKL